MLTFLAVIGIDNSLVWYSNKRRGSSNLTSNQLYQEMKEDAARDSSSDASSEHERTVTLLVGYYPNVGDPERGS
jgi:hypothetical protein